VCNVCVLIETTNRNRSLNHAEEILKRKEVKNMKTFETPKVIELGTLQQIVLSGVPILQSTKDQAANHETATTAS
jgi:hypothetical protein